MQFWAYLSNETPKCNSGLIYAKKRRNAIRGLSMLTKRRNAIRALSMLTKRRNAIRGLSMLRNAEMQFGAYLC